MGALLRKNLRDLGGGHNDGLPATKLADNESARLANFYPYGSILRRRPGIQRYTTSPYPERLNSVFVHRGNTGAIAELVGAYGGIAALSGALGAAFLTGIPSTFVVPSSNEEWRFRQFKDVTYAVRKGAGYLVRVIWPTGAGPVLTLLPGGLPAPPAGPTVVAAGAVPAGDAGAPQGTFFCVQTAYDANTGYESNPSPASPVVLAALGAITWGHNAYLGTGYQKVTHIRCYRSLVDRDGRYFFVGQYDATNPAAQLVEGKGTGQYGVEVSLRNGTPPVSPLGIETWNDRVWLHDGRLVYPSEILLGESFAGSFPVYPDDGHTVTTLCAWDEARLVVAKSKGVHYIVDDGSSFDLQTLTYADGCVSPDSMRTASGNLIWFSGDDFLLSQGGPPVVLSDPRVRDAIDAMQDQDRALVSARVDAGRGWYIASVSVGGARTQLLVYDYRQGKWWTAPVSSVIGVPDSIGEVYDAANNEIPFLHAVTRDGYVYKLFVDGVGTDAGQDIVATWTTKSWGSDVVEAGQMAMRRVNLLTSAPNPGTIKARLLLDGSVSPYKERSIDIAGNQWRRLNLTNMDKLAAEVQLEVEYRGADPLDIEALSFELVGFERMKVAV